MANFEIFPKPIEPDRTCSEKAPNCKRRLSFRVQCEYRLGYQVESRQFRFWPTRCAVEPA